MKKIIYLMIATSAMLSFQSCNDDEFAKERDLIGIWTVQDVDFNITVNDLSLGEFFDSQQNAAFFEAFFEAEFSGEFDNATIEFKSDNTYSATQDGDVETGTWSLNSDGSQLILDGGTIDESMLNIITSTSNSLILNFEEIEDSEDLNGDSVNDEVKITIELTLAK